MNASRTFPALFAGALLACFTALCASADDELPQTTPDGLTSC